VREKIKKVNLSTVCYQKVQYVSFFPSILIDFAILIIFNMLKFKKMVKKDSASSRACCFECNGLYL